MSDILLATLNARYCHAAFGLRSLMANLGSLRQRTRLLEFSINDNRLEILAELLLHAPRITGLGVYIWNVQEMTRLVADLKRIRPELLIVLGGPEVSYEAEDQPIVQMADYVISGEADLAFPELCQSLLAGARPASKFIAAPVPPLDRIELPYEFYTDEDIAHRVLYVEASRGCPFTCEFCLSALNIPVRAFSRDAFLEAMQRLLDRGARQFKFVDRTFNLNLRDSQAILQFFLDRYFPGLFLHFEMIPDRLPDSLRDLIRQFPAGALQFEIGIQTFNEDVGRLISRRQNNDKVAENFRFLRQETGVHLHADLIVGLPGETLESFASGFDRLIQHDPQEIQVGILKRLRGTPIIRHDAEFQMIYSPTPPYEILSTRDMSFEDIHQMRRFARYWDLISNSGNFIQTRELLWSEGESPFAVFLRLSRWLFDREKRTHGIPLPKLAERLFEFLTESLGRCEETCAQTIWKDYIQGGREDRPHFLRRFDLLPARELRLHSATTGLPSRQMRHLQT